MEHMISVPRIKVRAQQLGIGSWKSDCHQACELRMGQATVSRSYFVLLTFFLLILELYLEAKEIFQLLDWKETVTGLLGLARGTDNRIV
jgi:hypothetical protein